MSEKISITSLCWDRGLRPKSKTVKAHWQVRQQLLGEFFVACAQIFCPSLIFFGVWLVIAENSPKPRPSVSFWADVIENWPKRASLAMGDELNEKQPSLFGQLSFGLLSIDCKLPEFGQLFLGSWLYFFGEKWSNPFSRRYFFGQLDLDQLKRQLELKHPHSHQLRLN